MEKGGGVLTVRIGIVLITWGVAFLLYRKNKTVSFSRWVSLVIFIAGSTTFVTCIQKYLLPFIKINLPHWEGFIEFLHFLSAVFAYFCVYLFPYAVLMSCIVFSGWFSRKWKNVLKLILLTPIIPLSLTDQVKIYPNIDYDFQYINLYTGIYILTGCLLLLFSVFITKQSSAIDKNRKRTSFYYTPMVLWIGFSNYLNVKRFWIDDSGFHVETQFLDLNHVQHIFYTICYVLILFFIYFAVKHGLFGVRLKIEQQRLDYTMKSVSISTNFLNHTIKNEIQKLHYLGYRTKDFIKNDQNDQAIQMMDSMFHCLEHMQNMVDRIREKTEEIHLQEKPESLISIIEANLSRLKPVIEEKEISLKWNHSFDVDIFCDKLHLSEVINNIIMNSYDAMEKKTGILEIRLHMNKKNIVIEFKDNGCGITNENLTRVFDPFFSTKKSPFSYGLGLSYCYAVVQKHQGSLSITSMGLNKGTTVAIKLPISKVIKRPVSVSPKETIPLP